MQYNQELLIQAAQAAAASAGHFDMTRWIKPEHYATRHDVLTPDMKLKDEVTLCLGAWCLYLYNPELFALACDYGSIERELNKVLDVDLETSSELEHLFCLEAHRINACNVIDATFAFINAGSSGLSDFLDNWETQP